MVWVCDFLGGWVGWLSMQGFVLLLLHFVVGLIGCVGWVLFFGWVFAFVGLCCYTM